MSKQTSTNAIEQLITYIANVNRPKNNTPPPFPGDGVSHRAWTMRLISDDAEQNAALDTARISNPDDRAALLEALDYIAQYNGVLDDEEDPSTYWGYGYDRMDRKLQQRTISGLQGGAGFVAKVIQGVVDSTARSIGNVQYLPVSELNNLLAELRSSESSIAGLALRIFFLIKTNGEDQVWAALGVHNAAEKEQIRAAAMEAGY